MMEPIKFGRLDQTMKRCVAQRMVSCLLSIKKNRSERRWCLEDHFMIAKEIVMMRRGMSKDRVLWIPL